MQRPRDTVCIGGIPSVSTFMASHAHHTQSILCVIKNLEPVGTQQGLRLELRAEECPGDEIGYE